MFQSTFLSTTLLLTVALATLNAFQPQRSDPRHRFGSRSRFQPHSGFQSRSGFQPHAGLQPRSGFQAGAQKINSLFSTFNRNLGGRGSALAHRIPQSLPHRRSDPHDPKAFYREAPVPDTPVREGFRSIGFLDKRVPVGPKTAGDYAKINKGKETFVKERQHEDTGRALYGVASVESGTDAYNQEVKHAGNQLWAGENGQKKGFSKGEFVNNGVYQGEDHAEDAGRKKEFVQDTVKRNFNLNFNLQHQMDFANKYKDENHKGKYFGDEFDVKYKAKDVKGGYFGKKQEDKFEKKQYDKKKSAAKGVKGGKYLGGDRFRFGSFSGEGGFYEKHERNPGLKYINKSYPGEPHPTANIKGAKVIGVRTGDDLYAKFRGETMPIPKSKPQVDLYPLRHTDDSASGIFAGKLVTRTDLASVSEEKRPLGNYKGIYGGGQFKEPKGVFILTKRSENDPTIKAKRGVLVKRRKDGNVIFLPEDQEPKKYGWGGGNEYYGKGRSSKDGIFRDYGADFVGKQHFDKEAENEAEKGAEENVETKTAFTKGDFRNVEAKGHNKAAQYKGDYTKNDKVHKVIYNVKHRSELNEKVDDTINTDQGQLEDRTKGFRGNVKADQKFGKYHDDEFKTEYDGKAHAKNYKGEEFENGVSVENGAVFFGGKKENFNRKIIQKKGEESKEKKVRKRQLNYGKRPHFNVGRGGRQGGAFDVQKKFGGFQGGAQGQQFGFGSHKPVYQDGRGRNLNLQKAGVLNGGNFGFMHQLDGQGQNTKPGRDQHYFFNRRHLLVDHIVEKGNYCLYFGLFVACAYLGSAVGIMVLEKIGNSVKAKKDHKANMYAQIEIV